ncbi:peptidoglycan hydrolase CwlO-like protein [Lachnospiraceae bacterium PFB1-21]
MSIKFNKAAQLSLVILLVVTLVFTPGLTGHAEEPEEKLNNLGSALGEYESELGQATKELEALVSEVEASKMDLLEAEEQEAKQHEEMKLRIKYMYETGSVSLLQLLIESSDLASLTANIEYVSMVTSHDREMLTEYQRVVEDTAARAADLEGRRNELSSLQTQLNEKIASTEEAIKKASAEVDAKRKAELEALQAALDEAKKYEDAVSPEEGNNQGSGSSGSNETTPPPSGNGSNGSGSNGALYTLDQFLSMGVVNWGGYRFTYYSQSVLPGPGLNIPGRHVNADGYVSDGDGYIVLAALGAKGAVYDTPFGYQGKVYDSCPSAGTLDVYIR